jgi:chromosome segregation ATPase
MNVKMPAANIYETVKRVIQDLVAPSLEEIKGELKAINAEIKRLDERINSVQSSVEVGFKRLDEKIESLKSELLSEIKRLDARIDSVEARLETKITSLEDKIDTAIELRERIASLETKVAALSR